MYTAKHMKWWGWGDEEVGFDSRAHPGLWPYAKEVLDVESDDVDAPHVPLEAVRLRDAIQHDGFLADLRRWMRDDQICDSRRERVIHAYGKGFRDLFRMRRGLAEGAPDLVLYPENESDVLRTLRAAARHDVVIIPFGGGSNIAGCLERSESRRMVVSLDMRRMRRVLEVDTESFTARIEAGAFGPDLEEQLNAYGLTLGHFPDSFLHSTLGGWIATRSAGMQSDKYGKIEDMVIALRMVTPVGVLATRTVPKSSNGIDVNHLCIGSEGTLGVITEATMRVHPRPELRRTHGYLFPEFEAGIEAMHECVRKECVPSMLRLSDPDKTALSLAFKPPSSRLSQAVTKIMKSYLKAKGFDSRACLMLTTFEGGKNRAARQHSQVNAIYRRFGAVDLGSGSGKSFRIDQVRFSPHPRLSAGSRYHFRCERDFDCLEQSRSSVSGDNCGAARRDPGEWSKALGRMPHQPHLSERGQPVFNLRLQAAGWARNAAVSAREKRCAAVVHRPRRNAVPPSRSRHGTPAMADR